MTPQDARAAQAAAIDLDNDHADRMVRVADLSIGKSQ